MKDALWPITLTRKISEIHSGGFSMEEEKEFGFSEGDLFQKPESLHELVTFHKKNLARNLIAYKEKILKNNPLYTEIKPGVFTHTSAHIDEYVSFNTQKGLIIIEEDVLIKPFSYLVGPLRICKKTIISPHSYISNAYIGIHARVGGEVSNSIIESYSNKAHYGYVGDSFVGSWVNIAGGASTSNLKNTYGEISLGGVKTKEQFLGSFIADYAKIATNISMYTGKIIGVSSHIYGTVIEDVPSFTNYISKDNKIALPIDVSIQITERMQKRREVVLTEEIKKMLSYAYEQTEDERKEHGVKEGKLSF